MIFMIILCLFYDMFDPTNQYYLYINNCFLWTRYFGLFLYFELKPHLSGPSPATYQWMQIDLRMYIFRQVGPTTCPGPVQFYIVLTQYLVACWSWQTCLLFSHNKHEFSHESPFQGQQNVSLFILIILNSQLRSLSKLIRIYKHSKSGVRDTI